MDKIRNLLYQGDKNIITKPIIRRRKYNREYGPGEYFYNQQSLATRDVERYMDIDNRNINAYEFDMTKLKGLKIKEFKQMNNEWIDFVKACRGGENHDYDIIVGPMPDGSNEFWRQQYPDGVFGKKIPMRHLTEGQFFTTFVFFTERALECLTFVDSQQIPYRKMG